MGRDEQGVLFLFVLFFTMVYGNNLLISPFLFENLTAEKKSKMGTTKKFHAVYGDFFELRK